jgi:hypothetical protein
MSEITLCEKIEALNNESKYKESAELFLKETETTLKVELAVPQKVAFWGGKDKDAHKHFNYSVELSRAGRTYQFDFWGCQRDFELAEHSKTMPGYTGDYRTPKEEKLDKEVMSIFFSVKEIPGRGKFDSLKKEDKVMFKITPDSYTILSSLDIVYEDTFEDWCSSYGYSTDSIQANKTYMACIEQDRALRRMFSSDELEALGNIR